MTIRHVSSALLLLPLAAALLLPPTVQTAPRKKSRRPNAPSAMKPVALLPAIITGDGQINLQDTQKPIVHLAMAQHGVTIIEVPANDGIFAVHPGDEQMVIVQKDSPTMPKDRFIILRAGVSLPAPLASDPKRPANFSPKLRPATTLAVQMQSGLVLTLMVYPVADLSQQTHRLVISYNRREVVAGRRAQGLTVNLSGEDPEAVAAAPNPIQPGREAPKQAQTEPVAAKTSTPHPVQPAPTLPAAIGEFEHKPKKIDGWTTEPVGVTREALAQAIRDPRKFKTWTPPVHGISLSLRSREVNATTRLAVVAVKNTKAATIRLMPGHPEIFVETVNERGTRLQVEQIKKIHQATTTADQLLPAGAVVYYALVYETPLLSTTQRLRVAVGQTEAIDEPAGINFSAERRR